VKEEARHEAATRDWWHGSSVAVATSGAGAHDGAKWEGVHDEENRSFSFVEGYGRG
jgi:hypothetical protein